MSNTKNNPNSDKISRRLTAIVNSPIRRISFEEVKETKITKKEKKFRKIKDTVISKINTFVHNFEIEFYNKFIETHLKTAIDILDELYLSKVKEFIIYFENWSNIENILRQLDDGISY